MLVDTRNLVSAARFKKDLNRFLNAAKEGHGPVAVTQDSEVVGVFVSLQQYEALCDRELHDLLESRMHEPTISHEEVKERLHKRLKRQTKK